MTLENKKTLPFVSVIIPAYQAMNDLAINLESLHNQSYPSTDYEIIVVDNGENDGIENLLDTFPLLSIIKEEEKSSYAARNSGIRHSKGQVIVFTDADCIASQTFIQEGVKKLQSTPNCGLVGGQIKLQFLHDNRPNLIELFEHATIFLQEKFITKHKYAATANVFTYIDVINDVGFFKSHLKSMGDGDWGRRVWKAGYSLAYSEEAYVLHPTRRSFNALSKRCKRLVGGRYAKYKLDHDNNFRLSKELIATTISWHRIQPILAYSSVGIIKRLQLLCLLPILSYIEIQERLKLQFFQKKMERS